MNRNRLILCLMAVLLMRLSIGCGKSEPTSSVSKVAAPESPEFLKAQEEAKKYHEQKQAEETKQRSRRRLPQGEE